MKINLVTASVNLFLVLFRPALSDGSWAIAPCVYHKGRSKVHHKVGPSPRQVEDLPWLQHKGDGTGLCVEGKLIEVRVIKTAQCRAPFQCPSLLCVVEVLVVLRREDGPLFLSYYLVHKVVLAVDVALRECLWHSNPGKKNRN